MDDKEFTIPVSLIAIGLVLFAIYLLAFGGAGVAALGMVALVIVLAVQVVLGIVALYIVAALMSIGFGELKSAALKLSAIFIFPYAVSLFLPGGLDWLVALGLYAILLMWLLELESIYEIVVCMIVIAVVRSIALIGIGGMLAAM